MSKSGSFYNRRNFAAWAILAFAGLWATVAQAQLVTTVASPPVRGDGPYSIGYKFTVGASNYTINALGVYDMTSYDAGPGGGLDSAHAVYIWSSSNSSTPIATATVTAGTAGSGTNFYRYVALSSPLTLSASQSYYISTYIGGGGANDYFYDGSTTNEATANADITLNGAYYASPGGSLTAPNFPATPGNQAAGRWSVANAALLNFTWTGSQSTAWTTTAIGGSKNWQIAGTPYEYSDNVTGVTFDDTAGSTTVNISSANVFPTSVTFNNTVKSYSLTGSYGISGSASLAMTGSGLVTISNSNAFTGTTTISSGSLQLGNAAALLNSTVSVGSPNGLSFVTGTTATTIGGLSGGSSFVLKDGASNPVTLNVGNNNASTAYSGGMSGAGGLTKTGTGTLTLSNANPYTGATTISGGTVTLNGSLANTALITVGSGATLNLGGGQNQFQASNTGGTLAVSGILAVTSGQANTLYPSTITLSGGTMTSTSSVGTYGAYFVGSSGRTITASGTGNTISAVNIGLSGNLVLNTPLVTDSLTSSTQFFTNSSNPGLTKSGSGTVILTGTSTYTGATNVNGGNLYVNGALSTSSTVTVSGGATLGGKGTVGPATIQAGGTVEGGQGGIGALTLSSLTFSNSAAINLSPTSLAAINVTASNGLTASGAAGSVLVNIGTTTLGAGTYPLIDYSGTILGTGTGAFTIGIKPTDSNFYSLKSVAGVIDLSVALNAPYWSGANGTAWDTTTLNWGIGSAAGTPSTYSNGLAVVFDDTAGTNGTVVISGTDVSPASVTFNNSALNYTLQGTNSIAGSTGLTKGGSGTLTIANVNSFTGAVSFNGGTISVGTLSVGGVNSPLGAGTSLSFATGTLEYTGTGSTATTDRAISLNTGGGRFLIDNAGTTLTLSGSIGGVGGLTMSGPGGLLLSNTANSFTGGVSANGGTLTVASIANSGANSALGAGSSIALSNSATLEYTGVDAAPSTNRSVTLGTGGATFQVDNATTGLTLAGLIAGSGGLTKSGPGMLTLGNASNSYSGGTTISAGTLQITADGNLGTGGTSITIANGATLNAGAGFTTSRPITLGSGGGTINNLNPAQGLNLTGAISGGSLTIGGGNVILDPSSSNSLTSLTLASGITYIQNQNSIGTASISVNNGGVFDVYGGSLSPSNAMTFASGGAVDCRAGTLTLNTANATFPSSGTLNCNSTDSSASAAVAINGAYPVLTGGLNINVANGSLTLNGALTDTGSGNLTKTGGGTLLLAGSTSYSGSTTISGGYLQAVNPLPSGFLTINGGVLQTVGNSYSFNASNLSFTSGGIQNGSASTPVTITVGADNSSATYGGSLANGAAATLALYKTGSGVLALNAASTYTGGTTVNGGTLALNVSSAVANGTALTINNGGYVSLTTVRNAINQLSAVTINAGGILSADGPSDQAHTPVSNTGTLTINGGTMTGNANSDPVFGQFYLPNGATIHATGTNASTISGIMAIQSSTQLLTVNVDGGADLLISGRVLGNNGVDYGGINKTGNGTLDLSSSLNGTNPSGGIALTGVTLTAGTVSFVSGGLGSGVGGNAAPSLLADFAGNSTLLWDAGNTQDISTGSKLKINDGVIATLDTGGNNVMLGTPIVTGTAHTGSLIKTDSGTLTLSASNVYAGGTTINGGTLKLGNTSALGTGSLAANGGTLDLAGYSVMVPSFSGVAGIVTNSSAGSLATFTLNQSTTTTFSGQIKDGAGQVALNLTGSGALTLGNTNAYSGGTNVSSGTLQMGTANALPYGANAGNVTVNGGLDLAGQTTNVNGLSGAGTIDNTTGNGTLVVGNNNATSTFSGVLQNTSGSLALTKVGSGAFTLGSANTFAGPTAVQAGDLYLGQAGAITGPVSVSGGTLDASGFAQSIYSITMGSLGTLDLGFGNVISSTGTDSFAGTLDISGIIHTGELMSYTGHNGTFTTVNGLTSAYQLLYGGTELDIISSGPATWSSAGSGSWNTGANWTSGSAPSGVGVMAIVGTGTSSAVSITLDTPQTLGTLVFSNTAGNSSAGYSLDAGTAGTGSLTLDNSGAAALITVNVGSHAITAPVYLVGGDLTVSASGNSVLTISGSISQDTTRNLTLNGDGTGELILSGTNNLAGSGATVAVSSGTLVLNDSEALADGTSLTVGDASFFGGIQPAGAVTGAGSSELGAAVSLAPVPEPGTLVLLAAGLCIAAIYRRFLGRCTPRVNRL